jgi:hypothetical protein
MLGAASLWLAAAACWYASDWALAVALPCSWGLLLAFAIVSLRGIRATELERAPRASVEALEEIPGAVVDTLRLPGQSIEHAHAGAYAAFRGAMIGMPLAGFFVLLLSADDRFRSAAGGLILQSGSGVSFLAWAAVCSVGLLVAYRALGRSARRCQPDVASEGAVPRPYRTASDAYGPALFEGATRNKTGATPLTVGIALAHVVAVFALFVAAGARSLFADDAHLRAPGTITYARYVHEGFTQVSIATLLAVACVVAGHALLRRRSASRRLPGGSTLIAVELTLLSLVGVTLASSAHRLALYEAAYGYTYLRFGVWFLQLGVAGLLTMTAARCLARTWNGWPTALLWAGAAFAVLAGSFDADGWIARHNVARAQQGAGLDISYLESLSEDARGILPEVSELDPEGANVLQRAWLGSREQHRAAGWRSVRGLAGR